jgi:hypothetical protein
MEKQITMQSTWMLMENVKKVANRPVEWLRLYYSSVLERDVNMRQTWSLIEVQVSFFAGIMPANYSLLLRAAFCVWFLMALKRCRGLF